MPLAKDSAFWMFVAALAAADVLTVLVCLFSIKPMQAIASRNLNH